MKNWSIGQMVLVTIPSFFIGVSLVCSVAWLGGYDFNARDEKAVACALASLVAGIVGSIIPWAIREHTKGGGLA